jgi:methionine-rich copper-binding protein CopC
VIKASPATIQLWFSEKIELGLSRVRVVDAGGKSVSITPLTQDATRADAPVVGRVPAPLADGKYTVNWTAASGDGHAVKGAFSFTIKSR